MSTNIMVDIINICHKTDLVAFKMYTYFSKIFKNKAFCELWSKMALEELTHVNFWKDLLQLAQNNMMPQIFDHPFQTRDELNEIYEKMNAHVTNLELLSEDQALMLAYRLEFYVLHPAFEILFNFTKEMEIFLKISNPVHDYEEHLNRLIDALNEFGQKTPEIELLGLTLKRLWKENRALVEFSNTDSLTGLLNRRGFFQSIRPIAHYLQRNLQNAGLLMLDIDYFRKINEQYGHHKGDAVLKQIAETLRSSVRKSDICARYGGEEFIIFLTDVVKESIFKIAEKIRLSIEALKPEGILITVSIGCSIKQMHTPIEDEIEHFIKTADSNLYEAKNSSRNKVVI